MTISVLLSTFLLTFLLAIGLFFFIRASVKERIEEVNFVADQPKADFLNQIEQHFVQRAYNVVPSSDSVQNQITFEGFVRPSFFLAVFLSFLAAVGILCLVLVLSILLPQFSNLLLCLVLAAPIAGVFYWRAAARPERVFLKVEAGNHQGQADQTLIKVVAHRDELAELRRTLQLKSIE
jgi:hypothetical protein